MHTMKLISVGRSSACQHGVMHEFLEGRLPSCPPVLSTEVLRLILGIRRSNM